MQYLWTSVESSWEAHIYMIQRSFPFDMKTNTTSQRMGQGYSQAPLAKVSVSIVSARQIQRLVNSSKGCMLMVVRVKEIEMVDAF